MNDPTLSPERLLMRLRTEEKAREELQVRVDVLEHFIKRQFPEFFAGEVGTVCDPDLKPIPIIYGAPQEVPDGKGNWKPK